MIDVVVMAHPLRAAAATALAAQVAARIIWDRGDGEWDTAARAWATINPAATWGIVLQDDTLPIDGFRTHAAAALTAAPRGPVSFYVGTGRPREDIVTRAVHDARRRRASWLEADAVRWGVAVALPTDAVPAMLAWCEPAHRPYDQRITTWWRARHTPCRYTWPSLVDHADGASLVHHCQPPVPRRAHQVGVPTRWDGPVIPF